MEQQRSSGWRRALAVALGAAAVAAGAIPVAGQDTSESTAIRDDDVTPVPEAETWALLLAGAAAVCVRACRRRFSDPAGFGR